MIVMLFGWVILLPIAAMSVVLTVELALGLPRLPARSAPDPGPVRIAVVIPARDEAEGIAVTLSPLAAADIALHLLVVADNCSDDTAAVARSCGADVAERNDPLRRGKGYALAQARAHLAADPPDAVFILDADCTIDAAGIGLLCSEAISRARPVQTTYLMRPRRDLGPVVALSGFAFAVKNLVRQRGLARLGAPAILTGSGIAMPWTIFATAPLATAEAVEDLALGLALSRTGHPPLFREEPIVWTDAVRRGATRDQRDRWERGFLATGWSQAPSLLASRRPELVWLGLHLLVPPLALLMLLHMIVLAALFLSASFVALCVEFLLLATMVLMLALAWAQVGRAWLSGYALAVIPAYIVWKLPIYAAAMLRRERSWNRTRR